MTQLFSNDAASKINGPDVFCEMVYTNKKRNEKMRNGLVIDVEIE